MAHFESSISGNGDIPNVLALYNFDYTYTTR